MTEGSKNDTLCYLVPSQDLPGTYETRELDPQNPPPPEIKIYDLNKPEDMLAMLREQENLSQQAKAAQAS